MCGVLWFIGVCLCAFFSLFLWFTHKIRCMFVLFVVASLSLGVVLGMLKETFL